MGQTDKRTDRQTDGQDPYCGLLQKAELRVNLIVLESFNQFFAGL